MKTKIFVAFLIVIFMALLSNIIFEWLIRKDFENYVSQVREDQFYWIIASAESSYADGVWNADTLAETIHWAMMMGMDVRIFDAYGREVVSSEKSMESLPHVMKHRMEGLFHVYAAPGPFREYPLKNNETLIGKIHWRPFQKKAIAEKEAAFRGRIANFRYISLMIAGIGSLLLALLLSRYLSRPLTELKNASEKIARGDFSARIIPKSQDEVGKLSAVFNTMTESLQREERLRRQLLSNIAHELRTPLTIIKTQVEAMTDGIITDKEKGFRNISDEVEKLIRLVKGIEDVTTAEAGFFLPSEPVEVKLGEFLSGIADDMLPLFRAKGLDIQVEKRVDFTVMTDTEKVEMIVRNLLSNALKFTEAGGVLIIFGREKDIFFIEISDTGRGIPEERVPHIFKRFYKGEETDPGSLGLGLAIVKELVDAMRGDISVKSTVEKGTLFRVSLPATDE